MFGFFKKLFSRKKAVDFDKEPSLFDRWEKMAFNRHDNYNVFKDKSVETLYPITSKQLILAFQEYIKRDYQNKITLAEQDLCSSCKKKLHSVPNEITIKIDNYSVYRFHFECWESVNSVLDNKFKLTKITINDE